MKRIVVSAAVLAALTVFSATAPAGEQGVYVYGAAGQAASDRKAQTDATITGSGITAFSSSADETVRAGKLVAGFRFNRHIALEAGYVDLGTVTYRAASTAPVVATREGNIETSGWVLAGLMGAPFSDTLGIFAKAGVFRYEVEFECAGTGVACVNPNRTVNGRPPFLGLGLEWNPLKGLFFRAEHEIYLKVGEKFNTNGTTGTSKADVQLTTVGVGYRF